MTTLLPLLAFRASPPRNTPSWMSDNPVAFAVDLSQVATGNDSVMRLVDCKSGAELERIKLSSPIGRLIPNAAFVQPDGSVVLSGYVLGRPSLWIAPIVPTLKANVALTITEIPSFDPDSPGPGAIVRLNCAYRGAGETFLGYDGPRVVSIPSRSKSRQKTWTLDTNRELNFCSLASVWAYRPKSRAFAIAEAQWNGLALSQTNCSGVMLDDFFLGFLGKRPQRFDGLVAGIAPIGRGDGFVVLMSDGTYRDYRPNRRSVFRRVRSGRIKGLRVMEPDISSDMLWPVSGTYDRPRNCMYFMGSNGTTLATVSFRNALHPVASYRKAPQSRDCDTFGKSRWLAVRSNDSQTLSWYEKDSAGRLTFKFTTHLPGRQIYIPLTDGPGA